MKVSVLFSWWYEISMKNTLRRKCPVPSVGEMKIPHCEINRSINRVWEGVGLETEQAWGARYLTREIFLKNLII